MLEWSYTIDGGYFPDLARKNPDHFIIGKDGIHIYKNISFIGKELPRIRCHYINCYFKKLSYSSKYFFDCLFEDCILPKRKNINYKRCRIIQFGMEWEIGND